MYDLSLYNWETAGISTIGLVVESTAIHTSAELQRSYNLPKTDIYTGRCRLWSILTNLIKKEHRIPSDILTHFNTVTRMNKSLSFSTVPPSQP